MSAKKFTQEVADEICNRIAEGESLRAICNDAHIPHTATVKRWLINDEYEDFRAQYTRAREEQTETFVDQIVSIADEEDDPQRARVRIDARKWVASKLKPKKYGDRITNEHTGQINVTISADDADL